MIRSAYASSCLLIHLVFGNVVCICCRMLIFLSSRLNNLKIIAHHFFCNVIMVLFDCPYAMLFFATDMSNGVILLSIIPFINVVHIL